MKNYFLKEGDFESFVDAMARATKVIGPVAKKQKFVFAEIKTGKDVRLDYDVTILPAKKVMFPTRQALVKFTGNTMESCIDPQDQVLFGAHFYEVKAIDQLDKLFKQGHEDRNYLANREHTTIVVSNIQNVSERAFFASVGKEVQPKGHDAWITKVNGGYVFQALTAKGEALVKHGKFAAASDAQVAESKTVNEAPLKKCREELKASSKEISEKVRKSFNDEGMWKELAHECFSCGSCNIVCPTCYCFDVQDTWNLDQTSGVRTRSWDGCLLDDFAKVSLGGGHQENFREHRHQRYRHRVMRKMTYLNAKLDGPACVGCGRCSISCVPDIADPVKAVDRIMKK
jgi:sulfhydrogenase subunit beta (sulfur reductase)